MRQSLMKQPSASLPIAMSLMALVLVLGHAALFGIVHETDEGTAAHVFQLLMVAQLPLVAFFAFKWLPKRPSQARKVLAIQLVAAFAALAADLGGEVVTPATDPRTHALDAFRAAWRAVSAFPGWLGCGRWRFISAVTGGRLIATNTKSLFLVVGKRRFMPPVPSRDQN